MATAPTPSPQGRNHLAESGITIPSDSENYDAHQDLSPSPSPPSTSSSPLVLYKPPTLWGLVRGAAINLLLPFVNGLMLGFGELVANEVAFRLGWSGTKVRRITRPLLHSEHRNGYGMGTGSLASANTDGRYSPRIAPTRAASVPALRCGPTPWCVGGGAKGNWMRLRH